MIDFTQGPARDRIERQEVERLLTRGTLVLDERRRRPFYFDGRFLAARDLTREQDYFLGRQSDLGRAFGQGVVIGLDVTQRGANTIRVAPGHGITPSGESVVLTRVLDLDLLDLAASQKLDATFGLSPVPREPARNRTGLFVLALRPVEFSANPITSYPKTLTEPRTAHDGDIVEAVAATLIPYPDDGAQQERAGQRARVARDVFLRGAVRTLPANALPLAMLSLVNGVLQWADPFLVRREVGAAHGDTLSLGFAPRALREAHFQQYLDHLGDVLDERNRTRRGERFAATEHFLVLPPAGRLPTAALNLTSFTQVFFPPAIDVQISLIPEDELRIAIEESLLLPPIDLSLSAAEQESTAVLLLVPLARNVLARVLAGLEAPVQPSPSPITSRSLASRKPSAALQDLLRSQVERAALPLVRPQIPIDARWQSVISQTRFLWYVRRRNLAYNVDLAGIRLPATGNDRQEEDGLTERMRTAGLATRFNALRARATTRAAAEVVSTLAQPKFATAPQLLTSALAQFEAEPALDQVAARKVATRLAEPKLGEGIARLIAIDRRFGGISPVDPFRPSDVGGDAQTDLASNIPDWIELDRLVRLTSDEKLPELAAGLAEAAAKSSEEAGAFTVRKLEEGGS